MIPWMSHEIISDRHCPIKHHNPIDKDFWPWMFVCSICLLAFNIGRTSLTVTPEISKILVQDWYFFVRLTTQLLKFKISLDWKYLIIIEKLKFQKFQKNETRKIDNWVQDLIYSGFWNTIITQARPKLDPNLTRNW